MRLSKRIYKIAELVRCGDSAADIGTDHGYVPMLLIREGRSPRVIMSDISSDSLSKAVETFRIAGLAGRVEPSDFRTGDGLETIDASEVDEVIIAGLGGHTIADILAADEAKSKSFKRLILQPRKHSGVLRHFLVSHGWYIESENLAPEGKFSCEIITAVPRGAGSDSGLAAGNEILPPADDIRWKYPEAMVRADFDLARMRIGWKIGSIEEQLMNLQNSETDHAELEEKLRSDLDYLRSLIG